MGFCRNDNCASAVFGYKAFLPSGSCPWAGDDLPSRKLVMAYSDVAFGGLIVVSIDAA